MCILVYSQTCFLSEEMRFSEMKSRCSCLHSLLQRLLPRGSVAETMPVGSVAQRFPVAVSQHCLLTSTCYWASQADCLGNPAMLSHYDFITTCFLQVYIMQVTGDLNNSAQYMRYLASYAYCSFPYYGLGCSCISLAYMEARSSLDSYGESESGFCFPLHLNGNVSPFSILFWFGLCFERHSLAVAVRVFNSLVCGIP